MMWEFGDSLPLIRHLQEKCHQIGYHVALGGGVLNNGSSDKDLDLYFLPMGNDNLNNNRTLLFDVLEELWGAWEPINGDYAPNVPWQFMVKFMLGERRIDAFIV